MGCVCIVIDNTSSWYCPALPLCSALLLCPAPSSALLFLCPAPSCPAFPLPRLLPPLPRPLPLQSMVSGGCDSSVSTALLNAALGAEKVVALYIDNGFMRKNESSQVQESLEAIGLKLHGRHPPHRQEQHQHA